MQRFRAIDSHTGGEPTRLVFGDGLGLRGDSMADFREDFGGRLDHLRSAFVCEPRGSDVLVGALLVPGFRAEHGVIFFNNAGLLGMCGHGTIGVAKTLVHAGIWSPGEHQIDTPVGVVNLDIGVDGKVTFRNVPSFLSKKDVAVEVEGRAFTGDIAWGGNGFFLCSDHGMKLALENVNELLRVSGAIKERLFASGHRINNYEVDHVEFFADPVGEADSRNFVLCPGGAYDRSPCGTGTSAKVATLYSRGKLQPGEMWRQESITGSVFEAWVEVEGYTITPVIRGEAFVTAELELLIDPADPLRDGFTAFKRGGN